MREQAIYKVGGSPKMAGEHMMRQRKTTGRDRLLAAAGIVGPLAFTAVVLVQGVLQPDYSHVALPISALAAWPIGWLQNVNFVVFGMLIIAFAVGLHLGILPRRYGALGPGLLMVCGIGILLAAAFPWQRVGGDYAVPAGHLLGAALTFVGSGAGYILIAPRMKFDPRWKTLATYTLASGIAMVSLFPDLYGICPA